MSVKHMSYHGIYGTVLLGIAGWMGKHLGIEFERALIATNVPVVDVTIDGQDIFLSINK